MADPIPLVVFVVVVIAMFCCLLCNLRIPIPRCFGCKHTHIRVEYYIPPCLGVIVLLVSKVLTLREAWEGGMVGDDQIRPYVILILFNSLAYMCVAFDMTGCLSYLALFVAQRADSPTRLFLYFYVLAAMLTAFTSNDLVIMTMTPIALQCAKFADISPWPMLYGMFFAANTFSLIFIIANPTNVIIGQAFNLSFGEFAKVMAFPALVR